MRKIRSLAAWLGIALLVAFCGIGLNRASNSRDGSGGGEGGSPRAAGVQPQTGARGTVITITGEDLTVTNTVAVGGVGCQPVTLVAENQISCTVGIHGAETVDVKVTKVVDR